MWAAVMHMLREALAVLLSRLRKQATVVQTDTKTQPGCDLPEADWQFSGY